MWIQVKRQLQQQRSLKQEAFQQVDQLQNRVNDIEAAFSRGPSTTGKSLADIKRDRQYERTSQDTQQCLRPAAQSVHLSDFCPPPAVFLTFLFHFPLHHSIADQSRTYCMLPASRLSTTILSAGTSATLQAYLRHSAAM